MKSVFRRWGYMRSLMLVLTLSALGFSSSALASTGGLRITVTEPDGSPIEGAQVSVSSPTSLVSKSGTTSADGTLTLRGLTPGNDYTVRVNAPGYSDLVADNVAVVSDKRLSLRYQLASEATELGSVIVTGQSFAAVDTTSSTTGSVLTLGIVESLPTGRSYQSYLQLVPAVKPSDTGNPASRSGVNYANIGGDLGTSTDNIYILDGINVTDPLTGTFGANINSEIIKQQTVLTGGVPAKYAGGTGLVSIVTTKSGSNEFHGSLNYYFQNDSLVGDNEHGTSNGFSTYDSAFTLGGPAIEDELWFFVSYQKKHRSESVINPTTETELRTVDTDSEYGFFKATWQLTDNDRLQASFFNDPTTISGSDDPSIVQNRDAAREQGGDNYRLSYSREWDNFSIEAFGYKHEAEFTILPANQTTNNDVAYQGGNPAPTDIQRGGSGVTTQQFRNRKEYGLDGEYWLNTDWGTHDIQFGITFTDASYEEATSYSGPTQALYSSVALQDAGVTLGEYMNGTGGTWTGPRALATSDIGRIITAINESSDTAYFMGLLDTDSNGTISPGELQAYQLTQTTGNPDGQVNAYRIQVAQQNPYAVTTEGKAIYLQDTWIYDQWTVNAGLRTEQWAHFASTGEEIFTFDWEFAPRLSVVYDLFGDGTSKVWGFYGRYYDPVRNNMTDFAGALTGNVLNEQIYLGNQWLTYRVRGGSVQRDATFVPSTETPYTDEILLGYSATISPNTSFEVVADYRKTEDLLEDYALSLYSDPSNAGTIPQSRPGEAAPGDLFYLPASYYGYENGFPDNINYYIATLKGGEREYMGVTVSLTKYRSDNWMGKLSYTHNHFEGNSNSDSNADFQGDWIALDPRAPNRWGEMAGNIDHMFKAYGAYYFDNGFEIGGVFNWNSGYAYTKTFSLYGRHLPVMVDTPYVHGGVYDTWVQPNTVGAYEAPSYWTFDIRLKYTMDASIGETEFFMDIFNVFDNQATTHVMDLEGGDGTYEFQEGTNWVQPRRFYLGIRYSF